MPADEYTADSIPVVDDLLASVRRRPGMFTGDTSTGDGALHLVLEIVSNAVDQAMLGRCTRIDVRVDADDHVTISDDGPGIPAHRLTDLLERLSNRPTVDGHRPHVHLSPIGLGLPVSNQLSDPLIIDTIHASEHASVRYAGGVLHTPLRVVLTTRPSGTTIRLRPDPQIFSCTRVPRDRLTRRLEDLTYLIPGLTLSWSFTGRGDAGLASCVRAELGDPLGDIATHQGDYPTSDGPITVDVALAWHRHPGHRGGPQIDSFANLLRTEDGQHVDGLRAGVRAFLPDHSDAQRFDGLVAAVAVVLADVRYGNPTKDKLTSAAAKPAVKAATLAALQAWAARNPEAAATLHARGA